MVAMLVTATQVALVLYSKMWQQCSPIWLPMHTVLHPYKNYVTSTYHLKSEWLSPYNGQTLRMSKGQP